MIGAKAYFDYVNANGGVFGRKIEYRYLDDAYDPSRTVQNDAPARAAGQRVRDLQRRRHGAEPRGAAVPERAQGAAALRRHRRPLDRPRVQEVPVVDGLPPELLRGGTTLRPAPRRRRARTRRSPSSTRRATTAATCFAGLKAGLGTKAQIVGADDVRGDRHRPLVADRAAPPLRRERAHALHAAEADDRGLRRREPLRLAAADVRDVGLGRPVRDEDRPDDDREQGGRGRARPSSG